MAYYDEGLYDCVIVSQGFGKSSKKGTPCFWLSFRPEKLDGAPIGDNEYDREIQIWLTDNTIDSVVERLRGMGWTGNRFQDLQPGGYSFKGTNVKVRCTHEQNGEKVYERWELPAPPGTQQASENLADVAKRVDALFGAALKKKSGNTAETVTPQQAEVVNEYPPTEDDVPF